MTYDEYGLQRVTPLNTFCPSCELDPEADPRASAALCREHQPSTVGSEDAVVSLNAVSNWSEANGVSGRAIQSLIGVARETRAPNYEDAPNG